jgi:hypothetical protein
MWFARSARFTVGPNCGYPLHDPSGSAGGFRTLTVREGSGSGVETSPVVCPLLDGLGSVSDDLVLVCYKSRV